MLEQARPLDARRQAVGTATTGGHVAEERPQRRRGGGDRYPAPTLLAPHGEEGIDLFEPDIDDEQSLLAEPKQERANVPATVVDRVRRQATLTAHRVGELVDQISEGGGLRRRRLQASQEAKPIRRHLYEPLPAIPWIANTVMASLMTNPAVCRGLDIFRSDLRVAAEVDLLGHQQEFAGQTQQRRVSGAGACT